MAKSQDFNTMIQDMMSAFPVDMTGAQDAFKSTAALGEKMSKAALEAAEKSAAVSSKWTTETLAKIGDASKAKPEAADYSESVKTFASASAEMASENMAAFAEIAKKLQMETVELLMAAGKDMGEEATAAVKKATDDVTKAAKKSA
ncbi:phasin, PhaP [Profundibacter sp.]